jgi:hypothetical protein
MGTAEMNDWQEQQHADELAFQKAAVEALKASQTRPLTEEEAMTVAAMAGIASDFYREIRHD